MRSQDEDNRDYEARIGTGETSQVATGTEETRSPFSYSRLISVLSLRSHPPRVLRSPFARRVAPRGERDTVGGWGVRHDVSRSLALPSSVPSAGNRAHLGSLATLATPSAPLREVRKERERRRESKRRGDSMTGEDLTGRDSPRRRITLVGSFVHRLSVPRKHDEGCDRRVTWVLSSVPSVLIFLGSLPPFLCHFGWTLLPVERALREETGTGKKVMT